MSDYTEKDSFGNRMKAYEKATESRLDITKPIIVRIDGKKFSTYTKKMKKPFDMRMVNCMIATTKHMVEANHADFGYVQSDEITLVFLPKSISGKVSIPFEGRVQKTVSVFAAQATAFFLMEVSQIKFGEDLMDDIDMEYEEFPAGDIAFFDCRAFNTPDIGEAVNAVLWRIQDCKKNFVSCVYRWRVGHKQMQNLSGKEMYADMLERGIDAKNEYPSHLRHGTIVFRHWEPVETELGYVDRKVTKVCTAEDFDKMDFSDKVKTFDDLRYQEPK